MKGKGSEMNEATIKRGEDLQDCEEQQQQDSRKGAWKTPDHAHHFWKTGILDDDQNDWHIISNNDDGSKPAISGL